MQLPSEQERLIKIFHPYAREQMSRVRSEGTRFVHYTSAEAAVSILKNKEVWMRKSSCMNDFMEVKHGLACLHNAYMNKYGEKFKSSMNRIFEGLSSEIEQPFDSLTPLIDANTYLTCVSEHNDGEDTFGRLSMWRAYGKTTGVAFVMNNAPFLTPSTALKAYTSPVAYLNDKDFGEELGKVAENIVREADFLKTQTREAIKNRVLMMFIFAAVSTKHPCFEEEKEWRVVYLPSLWTSNYLRRDVQVIKGTPQPIYKIPLKNIPKKDGQDGLVGVEIPELIERIIIGPTQYPREMGEAFVDLLKEAGMADADKKVLASSIPLRQ